MSRLIRVAHLWRGHWIDLQVTADAIAICLGTRAGDIYTVVHAARGDDDLRAITAALLRHGGIASPFVVFDGAVRAGDEYGVQRISKSQWRVERRAEGAPDVLPIVAAALLDVIVERAASAQRMPLLRALLGKLVRLGTWRIAAGKTLESTTITTSPLRSGGTAAR